MSSLTSDPILLSFKKETSSCNNETKKKFADIIEEILSTGSSLDVTDCDGNTLLHLAILNQYEDCLIRLLNSGANLKLKNNDMKTPMDYALEIGNQTILYEISRRESYAHHLLNTEKVSDQSSTLKSITSPNTYQSNSPILNNLNNNFSLSSSSSSSSSPLSTSQITTLTNNNISNPHKMIPFQLGEIHDDYLDWSESQTCENVKKLIKRYYKEEQHLSKKLNYLNSKKNDLSIKFNSIIKNLREMEHGLCLNLWDILKNSKNYSNILNSISIDNSKIKKLLEHTNRLPYFIIDFNIRSFKGIIIEKWRESKIMLTGKYLYFFSYSSGINSKDASKKKLQVFSTFEKFSNQILNMRNSNSKPINFQLSLGSLSSTPPNNKPNPELIPPILFDDHTKSNLNDHFDHMYSFKIDNIKKVILKNFPLNSEEMELHILDSTPSTSSISSNSAFNQQENKKLKHFHLKMISSTSIYFNFNNFIVTLKNLNPSIKFCNEINHKVVDINLSDFNLFTLIPKIDIKPTESNAEVNTPTSIGTILDTSVNPHLSKTSKFFNSSIGSNSNTSTESISSIKQALHSKKSPNNKSIEDSIFKGINETIIIPNDSNEEEDEDSLYLRASESCLTSPSNSSLTPPETKFSPTNFSSFTSEILYYISPQYNENIIYFVEYISFLKTLLDQSRNLSSEVHTKVCDSISSREKYLEELHYLQSLRSLVDDPPPLPTRNLPYGTRPPSIDRVLKILNLYKEHIDKSIDDDFFSQTNSFNTSLTNPTLSFGQSIHSFSYTNPNSINPNLISFNEVEEFIRLMLGEDFHIQVESNTSALLQAVGSFRGSFRSSFRNSFRSSFRASEINSPDASDEVSIAKSISANQNQWGKSTIFTDDEIDDEFLYREDRESNYSQSITSHRQYLGLPPPQFQEIYKLVLTSLEKLWLLNLESFETAEKLTQTLVNRQKQWSYYTDLREEKVHQNDELFEIEF